MEQGEGERLESQRRKRFWTILGALFVLGGVAGFRNGLPAPASTTPAKAGRQAT